ncbi:MAG: uroporphyrinogen decarboxylase [Rhodopirellula sp.]|nr:uroporphyrinogen decarboxylase [Rhodopirellula sp.]
MTDPQWQTLLRVIRGELLQPLPAGLIIDSPWLPGWAGVSILDYFADEQTWLAANLKVVQRFPDVIFLPGFWSEFGMCTEPSAFGVRMVFPKNAFPNVQRSLDDYEAIGRVKTPDCRSDGLLPFVLQRTVRCRGAIEKAGHRIRFAVARGPLNIASYLLGHTEFLLGVKTNPDEIHSLLRVVTDFLVQWIALQCETVDSIDGIFLLDDLIGFLGAGDFEQFALPYLKQIYDSRDVSVKFLHNDAAGLVTARRLPAMGVNLFNFSFNHTLAEIRAAAGDSVTLLGNIPPRDVLAAGSPDDVRRGVAEMLATVDDRRRIVVSCGGGAPPGVSSENLDALATAQR